MQNPWTKLPDSPPYVIDSDRETVEQFNKSAKDKFRIHLKHMPEPYHGDPNADIIILSLNPGFDHSDDAFHRDNPSFITANRENLLHRRKRYPFYLLDPEFSQAPGYDWWTKRLKEPIRLFGLGKVSLNLCCIEYFPYHSKEYKFIGRILDSQKYSFYLVKEAIKRNAAIIMMRAKNEWIKAIPELNDIKYYTLNSPRSASISGKNMSNGDNYEGWLRLISILKN